MIGQPCGPLIKVALGPVAFQRRACRLCSAMEVENGSLRTQRKSNASERNPARDEDRHGILLWLLAEEIAKDTGKPPLDYPRNVINLDLTDIACRRFIKIGTTRRLVEAR